METQKVIKQLTNNLIANFFADKTHINGKEILDFCEEKQINMFILYMLMQEWKENIEDLKTPFFDYNNEEVKIALQSYMNTVSKHIKVAKNDFEPLVENAVNYTFQLAKNPESFVVSNHLEGKLEEINKYILLHKPYFDGDKNYEIEDQLPLLLERFNLNDKSITEPKENSTAEQKSGESINEKLAESKPKTSILEKFTEEKEESQFNLKKIENIKNAITINQRFIFINELFNGDATQYDTTISRLDDCIDYDQAKSLLAENLHDDSESESVNQLFLLIQQKYNISGE